MDHNEFESLEFLMKVMQSPKSEAKQNFMFCLKQIQFLRWLSERIDPKKDYYPLIEEYTSAEWLGGRKNVACRVHDDKYINGQVFASKRQVQNAICYQQGQLHVYATQLFFSWDKQ